MTRKIDFQIIDNNHYKEVEIDIYKRGCSSNDYVYVETITLDGEALLEPLHSEDSCDWTLYITDLDDRKKLLDAKVVRFMTTIYENTEEKPYPETGEIVRRSPLVDRYFIRPTTMTSRGTGNTLNFIVKNQMFYDRVKSGREDLSWYI